MTPSQRLQARKEAGFTMIELLVALTLLAFIMATIPALVRMAGQSVQVAGELTRSHADVQALDAIADKLSQSRPLLLRREDGNRAIQFWGTASSVHFIAPGVVGESGGLVAYDLELRQNRANQPNIVLARRLFSSDDDTDQAIPNDVRAPMPQTRQLAFRYFGPQGDDRTLDWSNHWDQSDTLPQLVEIRTAAAWAWSPRLRTVIVPIMLFQIPAIRHSR